MKMEFLPRFVLFFTMSISTLMAQTVYENYTFTTFVGAPGAGNFDGIGSAARFANPAGLAIDPNGNLIVADSYNHTIRKISQVGATTTIAGAAEVSGSSNGTGAAARFNSPSDVAVDADGNVYVADSLNHLVRKITPSGTVTTLAGAAGVSGTANGTGTSAKFNTPSGIVVDSSGNVFVADTVNQVIRKIAPDTTVTTFAGSMEISGTNDATGTAAKFNYPVGLAIDSDNNLYVSDCYSHTIRKITSSGAVTTLAGMAGVSGSTDANGSSARFYYPYGIACDTNGNLFVADMYNQVIRKIAPSRDVTTLAGKAGITGSADGTVDNARFRYPGDVTVRGNSVYVVDTYNETVRQIAGGNVTTLAGEASAPGSSDGTNYTAQFNYPYGISITSSNWLYIGDLANHTVRKVSPKGVVTTFAGSAGTSGTNDGSESAARFFYPSQLAQDTNGNVYVADNGNHTIRKITPAGNVTTFAGLAGSTGTNNGTGSQARFYSPLGAATDRDGNVYVGDTWNHAIRKITADGVVSTFAGKAGTSGTNDGTGDLARFSYPEGVAVDNSGNVYVADDGNHTIRKITSDGIVTTLAGLAGVSGTNDGAANLARFNYPFSVAVDSNGNVFVTDYSNSTVRKITPSGDVTTLGGLAGKAGILDGTGSGAKFNSPEGIAVDSEGNLYIADTSNHSIRKGYPALPDQAVVDHSIAALGITRHLDVNNSTTTNWSWTIVRKPANSSAELSSSSIRNPTFTPDVDDLYVLRFEGWNTQGRAAIGFISLTVDSTRPTLVITSPTAGQRWSNSVFNVTGTASDAQGISSIWYRINSDNWQLASGTTAWSGNVSLVPGTNTLQAYALDNSGNFSTTNSATIVYVVTATASVQIVGNGNVIPNYDGQLLEVGKIYSMTAKAGTGSSFAGWTGTAATNSTTLTFLMKSNAAFTAHFVDAVKPTIVITSPKTGQNWSNALFTVTGTAADNNNQVASVRYQLNDGSWLIAMGTTSWSANVTLNPGTNTLLAYALDSDANTSTTNVAKVVYILSDRLTVLVSGQGTVSPNYSNALLQIGKNYTITATPSAGNIFSNWSGGAFSETAALNFTMQSNLVLQANFVPNPFIPTKGTYAGLFYPEEGITTSNSGYFSATVTDAGKFSSQLVLGGIKSTLSGQFTAGGSFSNSVAPKGQSPLTVQLQLDLNGGNTLTGTIANGSWISDLAANRAIYSKTNFAPQGGKKYTLAIPGGENGATAPGGYSAGSVSVDTAGVLKFSGKLANGTKVTQSSFVSGQAQWPLFYCKNGELLIGWQTFANTSESDLGGTVNWIKAPLATAKLYSNGFSFGASNPLESFGSIYTYTSGVPVLNWTNGQLIAENGNLSQPLTNHISITGTTFVNLSSNKAALKLISTSGLISGTVTDPASGRTFPVSGALIQKQNGGFGFTTGTNQTGRLVLEAE